MFFGFVNEAHIHGRKKRGGSHGEQLSGKSDEDEELGISTKHTKRPQRASRTVIDVEAALEALADDHGPDQTIVEDEHAEVDDEPPQKRIRQKPGRKRTPNKSDAKFDKIDSPTSRGRRKVTKNIAHHLEQSEEDPEQCSPSKTITTSLAKKHTQSTVVKRQKYLHFDVALQGMLIASELRLAFYNKLQQQSMLWYLWFEGRR